MSLSCPEDMWAKVAFFLCPALYVVVETIMQLNTDFKNNDNTWSDIMTIIWHFVILFSAIAWGYVAFYEVCPGGSMY